MNHLRRAWSWCCSLIEKGEPYRGRPCDRELERVIHMALVALIAVALLVAWIFWPDFRA